jgi:uncharacterized membrane protein YphA (DoxX/SURF4 family)
MTYLKIAGTWLLTILLAVLMIGPGSQKFTSPTWERMFRTWGYPDGFYLVIGAVEVIAGLGLLVPKLASPSAIVLVVVMLGASATQMLRGGRNGVGELVFAVLLGVLAWIRWRDRIRAATPPAPATAP